MLDDDALIYAVITVFGLVLTGLLVAVLLRSRIGPVVRAWRVRGFESKIRRALQSRTPEQLARTFRTTFDEAVDPLLHARYWTLLGASSRDIRGEADRIERETASAHAAGDALAWALYGAFERAERILESTKAAPGHQSMLVLQLDFLVHLLRDRDGAGALARAHQGIAAAKSATLSAWMPVWRDRLRAAEVVAGERSFDDVDAFIRDTGSVISLLLISWAACMRAVAVADDARARAYRAIYTGVAPHCASPE